MKRIFSLWLLAFSFFPVLLAGENPEDQYPLPSRVARAAVGDWVEFRFGEAVYRHRVENVERTPAETFVHFGIETLDGSGKVIKRETSAIAGAQEREVNRRYAEAFLKARAISYSETVLVGEKQVNAVIVIMPDSGDEFWFSDGVGVLNLIRFDPGSASSGRARRTLNFGGAADAPGTK